MPAHGRGRRRPRLSDEALEYYGDLFITLGIAAQARISFEQFLVSPDYHLSRVVPAPSPPARRWWVWRWRALPPLLVAALAACAGEPAGPEGVARAFVDRYYAAGHYWQETTANSAASAHARNQCRHRVQHALGAIRGRLQGPVLDIGAGEGWMGDLLAPAPCDLVEPDPEQRALAARRR